MKLSIILNKDLFFVLVSMIGIIVVIISIIRFHLSKTYKISRFLSAVFYKEDMGRYMEFKDFCIEKKLLYNDENNSLELTDRGITVMTQYSTIYISYIALMISIISFFLSFSNYIVK